MEDSQRRRFREALGADAVAEDGAVLSPDSVTAVVAAMRVAGEARIRLRITSGGIDGSTPPDGGAIVSLHRLVAIEINPATGTARAEAGVTTTELLAALRAARLEVPGMPVTPRSGRIGSLIGRGELPRRSLCGIAAVLVGGDLVHFGGPVLKDVVGYDLAGTLLGSAGRLAAVVAVEFRLSPAAQAMAVAPARGEVGVEDLADAFDPQGLLAGA